MKQVGFAEAHWGMLIWAMLISSSFFAAAEVSQSIDPILLTGLRLLFSALMFLPLLLLKNTSPISARGLLAHAVLGLLLATYFGSLFETLTPYHRCQYRDAVHAGATDDVIFLRYCCCRAQA